VAVHIWLINSENKLLIQKRSLNTEISSGFWTISASGHVKSGETTLQTAIKETKEELGIDIKEKEIKLFTTYVKSKEYIDKGIKDNEFNIIFIVCKNINDFNIDKKEVEKIRFASISEIQELIKDKKFRPDNRRYHKLLFDYFKNNF
jgi:isopentenyldiphosphate isomerase